MSLVYGPQTFTTGSDQDLATFDSANWAVQDGASNDLQVRQSTDDARSNSLSVGSRAKYLGTLSVDHTIVADFLFGANTGSSFAGITARNQSSGVNRTQYLAQWTPTGGGTILLYRVINTAYTVIDSFGTVAINSSYPDGFIQVALVGASVTIKYGDAVNGIRTFPGGDTDAARILTGTVGLDIFEGAAGAALNSAIDNVRIYDDQITAGGHGLLLGGRRNSSVQDRLRGHLALGRLVYQSKRQRAEVRA